MESVDTEVSLLESVERWIGKQVLGFDGVAEGPVSRVKERLDTCSSILTCTRSGGGNVVLNVGDPPE